MQKISGELFKDKIIITKPKDIGRLYGKSHFGKTIKNNKLNIDLIEGVFLLEEEKINLFEKENEINFIKLLKKSILTIPNFEIKYIVFRDLRKKGYIVKNYDDNKKFDLIILKNKKKINEENIIYFVSIFSERDIIDIKKIKKLINNVNEKNRILWISIVDEEGDITYYEISKIQPKGENLENKYSKTDSILMDDRVLIFNDKTSKKLFEEEFYGKPFGKGLQISLVEALYLLNKDFIKIQKVDNEKNINFNLFKNYIKVKQPDIDLRFDVYKDLKKRGLIVKTGFKFGTHFRAYTKKPNIAHAEYLVHVVNKNFKSIWSDFSRAIRLAHSVNKEIIFAIYNKKIEYIKLGRLRP
jgi:tRNA-intron endonuclease